MAMVAETDGVRIRVRRGEGVLRRRSRRSRPSCIEGPHLGPVLLAERFPRGPLLVAQAEVVREALTASLAMAPTGLPPASLPRPTRLRLRARAMLKIPTPRLLFMTILLTPLLL